MDQWASRRYGIFLVAASAVMWSTAGLFVRMADVDTWTMVAWRSVFTFLTLGIFALVQKRAQVFRGFTTFGWQEIITLVVTVLSAIAYVLSLRLTTVANVMTVYAALPFIATGIAFIWVGERVTRRFLIAGSLALVGIALMTGGVTSQRDLWGVVAALAMTFGFAFRLVHTKRHPSLDMTLLIAIAAAISVPIAIPFMQFEMLAPKQLLGCALYGALTTGFAYILVLKGGRLISSGEAGLISMLDVVLGPFWVWLFYNERPTELALISGAIVLGAVLWYLGTNRTSDGRLSSP